MTIQGRRGQHSCPVSLGLTWMRSPDLWDVFSREGVIDMEMRRGKLSEAALNYSASLSIFGRACYVRLRDATTPSVFSQITSALYPSEFARCAESFRTHLRLPYGTCMAQ